MAQNRNYKGKSKNYKGKSGGGGGNYNKKNYNNNKSGNYRQSNNRPNNNRSNNQNRPPRDQQQQGQASEQQAAQPQSAPAASSGNDLLWFFLVVSLVTGGFLFNKFYLGPKRPGIYNSNYVSPPFRKEGNLSFLDAQEGKNIIDIEIEIANTVREKNRGLKNRKFLPANGGFLYVYQDATLRTFTMESVYLTLDMLFINSDQEIIRISKNAQPQSPVSIPSGGKAQYVLQVQGGFCDAFNIRMGDRVEF